MRLCLGLYNNVQRLPRIHSHIRGLFWTSKLFLLAWTWRPPLISQLTVCTCHLSECVYVWVCIIMCKDCREYIFTFMACFGHQSCFRWRRLGGRHWLHNCPFAHQSWANNVQRLPQIHSHIRGLFWTSKLFLLASTWRPPPISQLPVCTCHLVNAFMFGSV